MTPPHTAPLGATVSTTLTSGSRLSRYHVISPLGAGGMGEVYLARDESLERSVALKVLPPELVRNEERLRRFVQEAKAASSLSHPHIVTIYEIGEAEIQNTDRPAPEPSGPHVHFIAMELVSGETIGKKIHDERVDLKTLLRYLAQAAEGLAKAHAAGIIHRDLKPDNIMVSKDGYAKVLDFGLAKLTEQGSNASEGAVSATEAPTAEGVVMGTAGYMSPEQVRGRGVDHRSDVFSFGCILYEAATRRRPFIADSDVETMHQILRDEPPPIEQLNPHVPLELRRLIRRCLSKSPDQRLQSMKDLAIELGDIAEDYDNLSFASGPAPVASGPHRSRAWAWTGRAAYVVLAVLAAGAWWLASRSPAPAPAGTFATMKLSRLASIDNLADMALSPDGKYLAMVVEAQGRQSLSMRQVATGSDLALVPFQTAPLAGVTFSPDGNYVYYLSRDLENRSYSALYQVPTLGGPARKVLFDVDTAVTFSPDGRQFAFLRGYPQHGEMALMVAASDGSGERKLAAVKDPENVIATTPAWSPDGRTIVVVRTSAQKGVRTWLAAFALADGKEEPIGDKPWATITNVAWLPDGTGFFVVGSEWDDATSQVWLVSYPDGRARRVTNDLNRYVGLSVSSDGATLATLQTRRAADLWIAPIDDPAAMRKLSVAPAGGDALRTITAGPSGSVIAVSAHDGTRSVWSIAGDGSGLKRLSPPGRVSTIPAVASATGEVFFTSLGEDRVPHVWKVDPDGGNLTRITDGAGEILRGVAPDGRSILVGRSSESGTWMMSIPSGSFTRIAEQRAAALFSPDGRSLLMLRMAPEEDRVRLGLQIVPVGQTKPSATLAAPDAFDFDSLRWAPSGDAITYLADRDGAVNVWLQPLAGGPARRLTDFKVGRVFEYDWFPDGKQLVLSGGQIFTDVVLISEFR